MQKVLYDSSSVGMFRYDALREFFDKHAIPMWNQSTEHLAWKEWYCADVIIRLEKTDGHHGYHTRLLLRADEQCARHMPTIEGIISSKHRGAKMIAAQVRYPNSFLTALQQEC
jgi:hypothetical protein